MAWFGKSEKELSDWQKELDAREKDLNEKQAELDRLQHDLANKADIANKKSEELTKKDADICSREEALTQRELNAKNDFIKERREAFKEAIEIQLKDLDLRSEELNKKQDEMELQLSTLKKLEGELARKERKLKEEELVAENGFAGQNKIALRELEKRENDCKVLEKKLQDREEELSSRHQEQERRSEELRKRETTIVKAEQERDEGFTSERKKLDDDLIVKRLDLEKELAEKRTKEVNLLEVQLSEEAAKRREVLNESLLNERKRNEELLQAEKEALATLKKKLDSRAIELDELKGELEYQKQRLQSQQGRLEQREVDLQNEVEENVSARKQSFEREKSTLNDEIFRLREAVTQSGILISSFEELKRKLGNKDPAAVLLKLKTYEEEIKTLRDDLVTRPTLEMQESFDRLKSEKDNLHEVCGRLSEENRDLRESAHEQAILEMQIAELTDKNKSLQRRYESMDTENNRLAEEIKRLQTAYERKQDRETRVSDIEAPYFKEIKPRAQNQVEEIQWLDGISKSCEEYGLKFPRRILYAFHTALKTSEWSPITVLAGVSGTGKSELPRLYSHFGGLNFLSLSVQPNWDSQESMLGFFNSIDNKFDAQPVLRLLAQSQKAQTKDYPYGLKDVMSLILMDEMNLAHVELYFAEFLSKLELRRGRKGDEVPNLEVKLGAGIQHYDLPLGRNVLWTGTMNQDETTKSLSDKVLDRGIIINFPRPTTLERRSQLKALGEQAPLLSRKLWESWWCRESKFEEEQILPYKGFIEEMNNSLARVGRALGHRVWQSVEYYMSNYPDVLEAQKKGDSTGLRNAMKLAFEDQLVQKVMPKLRGIETRGKSKSDCLDKIRAQLVNDDYGIVEDFDLACEFGYGQFIWSSANYLKEDELLKSHNGNSSNNVSIQSLEQVGSHNSSLTEVSSIPEELYKYANHIKKKLWQLTANEIMNVMNCDIKVAKLIKGLCNQTKES